MYGILVAWHGATTYILSIGIDISASVVWYAVVRLVCLDHNSPDSTDNVFVSETRDIPDDVITQRCAARHMARPRHRKQVMHSGILNVVYTLLIRSSGFLQTCSNRKRISRKPHHKNDRPSILGLSLIHISEPTRPY